MKVVVLGGGVIGVAAAYYLARDGHEVEIIERNDQAASETSFANAGLFAPGHSTAWASPQAPMVLLRSLWRSDTALRFKPSLDPKLWAWSWKFLKECTWERQRANTLPKFHISIYSQAKTREILEETGIECDFLSRGILYLYRSAQALEIGIKNMAFLKGLGHKQEVIERDRVVEIEPGLGPVKERICGALFGPEDASGDCCKFARNLAAYMAGKLGVHLRFGETVLRLEAAGDEITAVVTDKGRISADVYVNSLGTYAPHIMKTVGVTLPIYPVKGYSLTLPIIPGKPAPTVGGIDEENLVAWAPLGDRMRMTSTAEFSGYDERYKPSDFDNMLRVAQDFFPDGVDYAKPSHWACLRPMTPDGPPVFGRLKHRNMVYNTGHGHIGWTMAAGSGKILADLVAGRTPEIDLDGMWVERFA